MRRTLITLTAISALALTAVHSSGLVTAQGDPVTITVSGWGLATTPEFQALADGFTEAHPEYRVELVEYDAAEYNTLISADLAAGAGPDVVTQKEVKFAPVLINGGQLLDVSDVELPEGLAAADAYTLDGVSYAVPYRMDSWVLFYNRDLYEAAGVAPPDGTWTWEDYVAALTELDAALPEGVDPAYQHRWQSTVQGIGNAQAGVDIRDGNFEHLSVAYERTLGLQDAGLQPDFNTVTANQLTYQGQFGTQKAANLIMGTWYVASLVVQQAGGDSEEFAWGIAPVPQLTADTAGTDNVPVTFGDPTGFGINAAIDDDKLDAAQAFLAYAASEDAALTLAAIGITPALITDGVVEAYFGVEGTPDDELSRFAWSTHDTKSENPISPNTAAIQTILGDLHTAVMSESVSVADGIAEAQARFTNEVG